MTFEVPFQPRLFYGSVVLFEFILTRCSALTSLFLLDTMKCKQTVYSQIQIVVLVRPLCLQ